MFVNLLVSIQFASLHSAQFAAVYSTRDIRKRCCRMFSCPDQTKSTGSLAALGCSSL